MTKVEFTEHVAQTLKNLKPVESSRLHGEKYQGALGQWLSTVESLADKFERVAIRFERFTFYVDCYAHELLDAHSGVIERQGS